MHELTRLMLQALKFNISTLPLQLLSISMLYIIIRVYAWLHVFHYYFRGDSNCLTYILNIIIVVYVATIKVIYIILCSSVYSNTTVHAW